MAPITGTAQSVIAHIGSRATSPRIGDEPGRAVVGGRRFGPQIEAGHEGPVSGRGEDRHADVAVLAEGVERGGEGGERRVVDRVHRRPVEGHDRDVVGDLDGDAHHGVLERRAKVWLATPARVPSGAQRCTEPCP